MTDRITQIMSRPHEPVGIALTPIQRQLREVNKETWKGGTPRAYPEPYTRIGTTGKPRGRDILIGPTSRHIIHESHDNYMSAKTRKQ